ncbi:MAG TPA: hypothetical protein P5120_15455 [Spirochaetota bacterium]|nr:hypothetical protein [Spirochaetota bacterium]
MRYVNLIINSLFINFVSSMIEVIPFAEEDFNEENPFAKEIMKTGIRII